MKVLVMDDEEKVCSLVCALILWDELGLELVGTAGDGLEGLKLIEEKNPDILITDIRMPSLDGLELIERAKSVNPNLQVIIISGYRQFDYAKKAIKFGVSDYLLKPIKQNELQNALKKMVSNYEDKKNYSTYLSNRDEIRSYYLINYLQNGLNKDKINELYDSSINIIMSLIKIDGEFFNYDNEAKTVIKNKLKDNFSHYLGNLSNWDIIYLDKYYTFLLIIPIDTILDFDLNDNLKKAFKEVVMNFYSLFPNLELTFCQGVLLSDINSISNEFDRLIELSYKRIDLDSGNYLANDEIELYCDYEKSDFFVKNVLSLFVEEEVKINEINKLMLILSNLNKESFLLTIIDITKKLTLFFQEQLDIETLEKISFEELFFINKKSLIINFLKNKLVIINELFIQKRKNDSSKPIKEAQNYIQLNYSDNQLSLDFVSNLVHLSSPYFSSLFKKETEKGFAEYLREVRIEKSKELLASTNLAIKDISKKVGYQDPRHFTKCFKSQLGIKPQDYRKLYG